MATRREQLITYLTETRRTPKELAALMRMRVADVLDDLEHVRQSAGAKFQMEPAECSACDYVFEARGRLSTPSKCPSCRAQRVLGPWLFIEA